MKIQLTEHPEWIINFLQEIEEYEDNILEGNCFGKMAKGELPVEIFRQVMINFYPLVQNFPKYMDLLLPKTPMDDSPGATMTRHWLNENINFERLDATWYRTWITGFGVPRELTAKEIYPAPEVDALNNFLWKVCTYGTLPEAIAGLNFAVGGPTGKWAERVHRNIRKYHGAEGVDMSRRSLIWLRAHANCGQHSNEALEIIKALATDKEEQERVVRAAKNGMAYYALAAETGYQMSMYGRSPGVSHNYPVSLN